MVPLHKFKVFKICFRHGLLCDLSEEVLKNGDSIVEIGNVLPNLHHVVVLIAPPLSELDQWDSLSLFQGLLSHIFIHNEYHYGVGLGNGGYHGREPIIAVFGPCHVSSLEALPRLHIGAKRGQFVISLREGGWGGLFIFDETSPQFISNNFPSQW